MGRDPDERDAGRTASTLRPRYARISAAGGATLVTLVALLGGVGVLPTSQSAVAQQAQAGGPSRVGPSQRATSQAGSEAGSEAGSGAIALSGNGVSSQPSVAPTKNRNVVPAVPADSGSGRRIVFDMIGQRVWLVGQHAGADTVRRTYLVSGSLTDNLKAGSYKVYSKSMDAVGVDDSGTMKYMVRFAHGPHAAIGFHDIPILHGAKVQTRGALGTPESHGCIRQWRPDARALWRFAPVGTKVVVVA